MPHRNMPPCGWVQCTSARKHFFHHFKHHIAAFLVNGADVFYVFIQKATLADFVGDILVEGGRIQIGALLGHDQFADDLFRRNHPRQPDTRSQQLWKRCSGK